MRAVLLLAAACLAAAGCATTPSSIATSAPAATTVAASPLPEFAIQGRFSVKAAEKSGTGNYRWEHRPHNDRLEFLSPTGQMVAELTRAASAITLRTADGKVRSASNWSDLLDEAVGIPVPVDALSAWVQGAPAAGDPPRRTEVDPSGVLTGIVQQGWDVQWLSHETDRFGPRPRVMTLSYGEYQLRLTIDQRNNLD